MNDKHKGPYPLRASTTESFHLLDKNKKECNRLLSQKEINEDEIVDALVGLHLVLEISINGFHRELTSIQIKKNIDHLIIMDNLDRISFIDKTVLFIYNSHFDFQGKIEEATKHHSIIGQMKKFAEIRNKLLHGSTVMTVYAEDNKPEKKSPTRDLLTIKNLGLQVESFKAIMAGMRFYAGCLGRGLDKHRLLVDDFIPDTLPTILKSVNHGPVTRVDINYNSKEVKTIIFKIKGEKQ